MQKKEGIRKESREGRIQTILLLGILFVVCFLGSFLLGRYSVSPKELGGILLSHLISIEPFWSSAAERVVFNIRLPRVLSAALIGAGLSAAGLCYQGLFQNPMVSPDVLGASAGAGFGAALGILLGFSYFNISAFSFVCGLGAVLLVQLVASQVKSSPMIGLVLGGIMISSLFSSGISFIKLVADPNDTLPEITYWLMGSLSAIRMQDLLFAVIPIGIGCLILLLLRWRLNILTLGEEEARSIGVNTRILRYVVILCATLITAACVSISGMIGLLCLRAGRKCCSHHQCCQHQSHQSDRKMFFRHIKFFLSIIVSDPARTPDSFHPTAQSSECVHLLHKPDLKSVGQPLSADCPHLILFRL